MRADEIDREKAFCISHARGQWFKTTTAHIRGPRLLGPVVAFAVAVSGIELLSLGRFFWALVFGLAVSLLLEREQWKEIHLAAA